MGEVLLLVHISTFNIFRFLKCWHLAVHNAWENYSPSFPNISGLWQKGIAVKLIILQVTLFQVCFRNSQQLPPFKMIISFVACFSLGW